MDLRRGLREPEHKRDPRRQDRGSNLRDRDLEQGDSLRVLICGEQVGLGMTKVKLEEETMSISRCSMNSKSHSRRFRRNGGDSEDGSSKRRRR